MKSKKIIYAVIAGGVCCILAAAYCTTQKPSYKDNDGLPTLVASVYINRDSGLKQQMVGIKHIPAEFREPQALVSVNDITDEQGMPKYFSAIPILKGEQITKSKLMPAGRGLSSIVPYGKVAVTIALPQERAVAGLLNPGDCVDIISTFDTENSMAGQSETLTLFRNVKILAVGKNIVGFKNKDITDEPESDDKQMLVTAALRPYEAAAIAHAQEKGSIRLTLRSPFDDNTLPVPTISQKTAITSMSGNGAENIDVKKLKEWIQE